MEQSHRCSCYHPCSSQHPPSPPQFPTAPSQHQQQQQQQQQQPYLAELSRYIRRGIAERPTGKHISYGAAEAVPPLPA
ncbi:hypothetical protein PGT21_010849 [Puccinia graminis f. sp. tritici]|uniref:Uncharacterized protein n=1 Tax=Puccinia graminis f. sp. tritici TaxID=56615 RepID=A0A5B0QI63_PUCGR|nr:hypothetical protein PGT21_010849 [Puccinia graminis f. sp. tritici]